MDRTRVLQIESRFIAAYVLNLPKDPPKAAALFVKTQDPAVYERIGRAMAANIARRDARLEARRQYFTLVRD